MQAYSTNFIYDYGDSKLRVFLVNVIQVLR